MLKKSKSGNIALALLLSLGFFSLLLFCAYQLFLPYKAKPTAELKAMLYSNTPFFLQPIFNKPSTLASVHAPDATYNAAFSEVQYLIPKNGKIIEMGNKNINNNDSIILEYNQSNPHAILSCSDAFFPMQKKSTSLFFITQEKNLACAPFYKGKVHYNEQRILIRNIDAMSIRYGEDTNKNGIANHFVKANYIDLIKNKVVSLRVTLLLRTMEHPFRFNHTSYYTMDGKDIGPYHDAYIRKVLITEIPLTDSTE